VGVPRFTTIARIGGMRSVHCARAVYTALATVPGVTGAEVVIGTATIDHDGRATADALRSAIALAGYELVETTEERQRSLPLL
jgi:copper chaperone CopZ